jgi:hypothetical protein
VRQQLHTQWSGTEERGNGSRLAAHSSQRGMVGGRGIAQRSHERPVVTGAGVERARPSGLRKMMTAGARDPFEFSDFSNRLQNG